MPTAHTFVSRTLESCQFGTKIRDSFLVNSFDE
jgi:hypothetical protein